MYPFIVITHILLKPSTHYRINLSPFTKDFRVWGAPIETNLFLMSHFRVTSININYQNFKLHVYEFVHAQV